MDQKKLISLISERGVKKSWIATSLKVSPSLVTQWTTGEREISDKHKIQLIGLLTFSTTKNQLVETFDEELKSQSTAALKSLLDYSKEQREYFNREGHGDMLLKYNEIIKKLEDELSMRLESIFTF